MNRGARSLLITAGLLASTAAFALELLPGDLLVTDSGGARVLRVRPSDGSVAVLAPQPSSNQRLQKPTGITIDHHGDVLVADATRGQVLTVDPVDGWQYILESSDFLGEADPVPVGDAPYGIADYDDGIFQYYYVASAGAIFGIDEDFFVDWNSYVVVSDPLLAGARDLAIQFTDSPLGPLADVLFVAGAGSGLVAFDFGTDELTAAYTPPPNHHVLAVDVATSVGSAAVFSDVEITGSACTPGTAAIYTAGVTPTLLSSGGLLRCPVSVAADSLGIYVGDVASLDGGNARILKLSPAEGGTYTQSLVADIDGTSANPASIAIVPEPIPEPEFALLSASALGTVVAIAARSRRQAKSRG